jgi:hypothetical protein
MSKRTPGPWVIRQNDGYIKSNDRVVCKLYDVPIHGGDQKQGNAKLIAAAPDLLEALKELVELKKMKDEAGEYPESLPSDYIERKPMAWENARRAIRKAEGGQK